MFLNLAETLALGASGDYEIIAELSGNTAAIILCVAQWLDDVDNWEGASYFLTSAEIDTIGALVGQLVFEITTAYEGNGGNGALSIAVLSDIKEQNTAGGTFTSGAWRTRTLQTEVDSDNIVSLSASQFTPIAGTFLLIARVPGYGVKGHQARLYNASADSLIKLGSVVGVASASYASNEDSIIIALFTVAAGQALEIQHQCTQTLATNGMGAPVNLAPEVYTEVILVQVT